MSKKVKSAHLPYAEWMTALERMLWAVVCTRKVFSDELALLVIAGYRNVLAELAC